MSSHSILKSDIRIGGLERQHVLFDPLDLAHQPVAAGRDHHVLAVCHASASEDTARQRAATPVLATEEIGLRLGRPVLVSPR